VTFIFIDVFVLSFTVPVFQQNHIFWNSSSRLNMSLLISNLSRRLPIGIDLSSQVSSNQRSSSLCHVYCLVIGLFPFLKLWRWCYTIPSISSNVGGGAIRSLRRDEGGPGPRPKVWTRFQ